MSTVHLAESFDSDVVRIAPIRIILRIDLRLQRIFMLEFRQASEWDHRSARDGPRAVTNARTHARRGLPTSSCFRPSSFVAVCHHFALAAVVSCQNRCSCVVISRHLTAGRSLARRPSDQTTDEVSRSKPDISALRCRDAPRLLKPSCAADAAGWQSCCRRVDLRD